MRDVPEEDPDPVDADRVRRRPPLQPQRQLVQRALHRPRARASASAHSAPASASAHAHSTTPASASAPAATGAPRPEREGLRVVIAHHHPRVIRTRPRVLLSYPAIRSTAYTYMFKVTKSYHTPEVI